MKQHVDLLSKRAQLLDRRRTINVGADHHHFFLLAILEELGELGDRGRLARALQTGHQNDCGRRAVQIQIAVRRAHHRGEFVAHDFHQRLAGSQALEHFLADCAHLHALDQRLHHGQRDVSFEQGDAHFAQRFADVGFGQARASAQALDRGGQALAQGFEHDAVSMNRTVVDYTGRRETQPRLSDLSSLARPYATLVAC